MAFDWISFTTDYGCSDGFVAACHGVIARTAPAVGVIDVTHAVPPQDVRHGAQVLAQTAPYLPPSVHLAVVDPGVGTARRGIVVVAADGLLVGPDNGLLLPAADTLGGMEAAYELTAPQYRLPEVAATFHGRDIFAPAAAHLARGVPPQEFGVPAGDPVRLPEPRAEWRDGSLYTEVLTVDHFGNLQLAARGEQLTTVATSGAVQVYLGAAARAIDVPVTTTFGEVAEGMPVLITDSVGQLTLAVNGGSAARTYGTGAGDAIVLTVR